MNNIEELFSHPDTLAVIRSTTLCPSSFGIVPPICKDIKQGCTANECWDEVEGEYMVTLWEKIQDYCRRHPACKSCSLKRACYKLDSEKRLEDVNEGNNDKG